MNDGDILYAIRVSNTTPYNFWRKTFCETIRFFAIAYGHDFSTQFESGHNLLSQFSQHLHL